VRSQDSFCPEAIANWLPHLRAPVECGASLWLSLFLFSVPSALSAVIFSLAYESSTPPASGRGKCLSPRHGDHGDGGSFPQRSLCLRESTRSSESAGRWVWLPHRSGGAALGGGIRAQGFHPAGTGPRGDDPAGLLLYNTAAARASPAYPGLVSAFICLRLFGRRGDLSPASPPVSVGRVMRPVFAALRYQMVATATHLAKPRFQDSAVACLSSSFWPRAKARVTRPGRRAFVAARLARV
jgi:hypothetical protein